MSRFIVNERRFRELVARRVINTRDDSSRDVDIVLGAEVDSVVMLRAIIDVMAAGERPTPDPPQAVEFLRKRPPK